MYGGLEELGDLGSDIKETPASQMLRDRSEVRGQGPPLMGQPGSQVQEYTEQINV